ncbi:glycerate dehydrogenase [Pseudomassariella vexata]|uniref:Glycerate dehydrogenase n=1 Tax=Pseudomassariella vexata TaxID=1141098 RepID=A0A1Y2E335_9PEZI|nr:glycerate dehydrogenase [Pseudomassariella vexata]ORY65774.1 glycerate dehydrogenase [Pseudomassariella vexata]
MTNPSPVHHDIVALETFFCPLPAKLDMPPGHTYTITQYDRTRVDQIAERIRDADIVIMTIINMSAEVLAVEASPRLKAIFDVASGTDSIDMAVCRARGIHVANMPHCNATTVAEHVIASYFAARRSITLSHSLIRRGEWPKRGTLLRTLDGPDGKLPRTAGNEIMGIIGWGAVGKKAASVAETLGMKVLVSGRKGAPASEGRTPFDTVIREATVIVLCLPRSPEVLNLVSTPEFEAMQSCCVLVNVSRGGIVDDDALVKALRERKIAGAASDVYLYEPAGPENSPLLAPDTQDLNLVTTPHVAWCSEDTIISYNNALKENISSWLNGTPVNTVI